MRHFHIFDTAIGRCGLGWRTRDVSTFRLPESDDEALSARMAGGEVLAGALPPSIARAVERLKAYFNGDNIDFSTLSLDLDGCSVFERRVYDATRGVGWGRTATYGEIARRIGSPGAARAVGHALSRNPVAIVVPCHRILAAGGKMGGFTAHGGARTKARLLAIEGFRDAIAAETRADMFAEMSA